jgi:hypothetical protein
MVAAGNQWFVFNLRYSAVVYIPFIPVGLQEYGQMLYLLLL